MKIKPSARVVLAVIAAVLVSLFLLMGMIPKARATEWNRWNVAPYATSQEEACKKAPQAIDGFNIPSAVKEAFKSQLGATCKGGKEVWLTPGMHLEEMWSGGAKPHVMSNKTVGELPVLKSPDGRTYRKGAVAETAKALSWEFVYEGKKYTLYEPFVCFNWSWASSPVPIVTVPVAVAPKCVELTFYAPVGGKVRWGVGSSTGPLAPDACNAQREGDGPWQAWHGECETCVPQEEYISKLLGSTAQVPHKYLYPVGVRKQTFRFSSEIWTKVLYFCLEDAIGVKTCGSYIRPESWKGQYQVQIPDRVWVWDDRKCPK
ncbi:hypothetical protein EXS57_02610 [Candidatus Kaiserbacteria bacterium]|nr:hypothetical protein [Candidatus Kaiserbacteria bacterium]